MKLYFSPGACSMAPHIALREAGYAFDLIRVDLARKATENGEDYNTINPKGYVPALRLDDHTLLTEAAVILQYLADQKPESGLAPKAGTMERYHLMEWLNFIASELHKTLGAFFRPNMTPEWRRNQLTVFEKRCDFLSEALSEKRYLMDAPFTVADPYAFTVLNWTHLFKIDLTRWPAVVAYLERVKARPKVQETLKAEGLIV